MSDKKLVAVFSSVLMLVLASETAWANTPIISNVKMLPGQTASIISVDLSGQGRAYPSPANEYSTNSILLRTGVFGGAEEKVTTKRSTEEVQTGVFWTPQGSPSRAQGDSMGNVLKTGIFGIPRGSIVEYGTGERHGGQGRSFRKRGSGHKIKPGYWRGL